MLYHVFQGWSLCSLMSFPLTFHLAVWLWPHWPLGCSSDMLLQNSTSDICWVNKWGWVWKSEKQGIADKPTVVPLSSYTDPRELAETRFQERCSAEQWNSPKALGPWSPQSLSSASAFLLFKQKHYLPPPHTWRTQKLISHLSTPDTHRNIISCFPTPGNTGDPPSPMIHPATLALSICTEISSWAWNVALWDSPPAQPLCAMFFSTFS